MQTETHLLAHLVIKVMVLTATKRLLREKFFIRRGADAQAIVHNEELPLASLADRNGFPCVHPFAINHREANKVKLDNHAYWSTGCRRSKNCLINQALVR